MAIQLIHVPVTPEEINLTQANPIRPKHYLRFAASMLAQPQQRHIEEIQKQLKTKKIVEIALKERSLRVMKRWVKDEIIQSQGGESLRSKLFINFNPVTILPEAIREPYENTMEIIEQNKAQEEELNKIKDLTPREYAEKIYLPARIKEDLRNENLEGLKAWIKTYPKGFTNDLQFFDELIRLAVQKQDADFLRVVVRFFSENISLIEENFLMHISILERLNDLIITAAETQQLPIIKALLNGPKVQVIRQSTFAALIGFAADTKNEALLNLIFESNQARWMDDDLLISSHSALSPDLKRKIDRVWAMKHPDLDGITFRRKLLLKAKQALPEAILIAKGTASLMPLALGAIALGEAAVKYLKAD